MRRRLVGMATATRTVEELLGTLVAHAPVSTRSNLPLVDEIAALLAPTAARIERVPSRDGRHASLVVELGPAFDAARGREGLLLCGHLDVVPADPAAWRTPPFAAVVDGDVVRGRGTCDMLGCVASAIAGLRAAPPALARPLALLLTWGEELGALGAAELAANGRLARLPTATVVGEPTGLRVVRMHKGHLKLRVVCRGRSAHSGLPHLGENAIEHATRVATALLALRDELGAERSATADAFEVPFVTLNLGRVEGGGAVNVVPDRCVLDIGLRPLPGDDTEELAQRVRRAVAAGAGAASDRVTVETVNDNPPLLTPPDADICRRLLACTGEEDAHAVGFASDAGHLARAGCTCVLFGPGSMEVAHRPDEHVPRVQLERCHDVLRGLVEHLCLSSTTETHGA